MPRRAGFTKRCRAKIRWRPLFRCNVNTRAVFANPGQLYYVTAYAMKLQENKDMCLKMVERERRLNTCALCLCDIERDK